MRKVDLSVLAIQETKQIRSDRRWWIPGCVVYESRPIKLGPCSRGLATIVRKDVFPEILEVTDQMIWIRFGRDKKKVVLCKVYIRTQNVGSLRTKVKTQLLQRIKHYTQKEKSVNLVVAGDFNTG